VLALVLGAVPDLASLSATELGLELASESELASEPE
jgi:hypothetical protein